MLKSLLNTNSAKLQIFQVREKKLIAESVIMFGETFFVIKDIAHKLYSNL
jgi:hypothetical protein